MGDHRLTPEAVNIKRNRSFCECLIHEVTYLCSNSLRGVDLPGDIVDQSKVKGEQFVYSSLVTDESTDVTATDQLL
ncbi:hypothetical protein SK128_014970, partial [Halocaridina rubra]